MPVPEGWEVDAMIARAIGNDIGAYKSLIDGSLTLYDFYSLLRLADWRDYVTMYARRQSQIQGGA